MQQTQILEQYEGLFSKWQQSEAILPEMFMAACGNYEYWVARRPEKLVMFGHTHAPMLVQYPKKSDPTKCVVYCNTGSFIDSGQMTFAGTIYILYIYMSLFLHLIHIYIYILHTCMEIVTQQHNIEVLMNRPEEVGGAREPRVVRLFHLQEDAGAPYEVLDKEYIIPRGL